MQIISDFLYSQQRLHIPFMKHQMIFQNDNNVIIHERYTEHGPDEFSLILETALITNKIIAKNDNKKIIITINPVIAYNPITQEAFVKKHGSNLISYDGGNLWLTTIQNFDADGEMIIYNNFQTEVDFNHAHCDRVTFIKSINDIVPRTYIEKNMYLEKDGERFPNGMPTNYIPKPAWCMMPKL